MFFFQAEDVIRDLVRSRGLGDVYKRQRHAPPAGAPPLVALEPDSRDWLHERIAARFDVMLLSLIHI